MGAEVPLLRLLRDTRGWNARPRGARGPCRTGAGGAHSASCREDGPDVRGGERRLRVQWGTRAAACAVRRAPARPRHGRGGLPPRRCGGRLPGSGGKRGQRRRRHIPPLRRPGRGFPHHRGRGRSDADAATGRPPYVPVLRAPERPGRRNPPPSPDGLSAARRCPSGVRRTARGGRRSWGPTASWRAAGAGSCACSTAPTSGSWTGSTCRR